MKTWTVFGEELLQTDGTIVYWRLVSERSRMKHYSVKEEDICEVLVTEDPEGFYTGWVKTGQEGIAMILPVNFFDIQFPKGHEEAEEKGTGKAYRLSLVAEGN